jgi:hypothetical protein
MLGCKVFESIEEKREYARKILIATGQWRGSAINLPHLQDSIPEDPPSDVLQPEVPVCGVAQSESRDRYRRTTCKVCLRPFSFRRDCAPPKYCSKQCRKAGRLKSNPDPVALLVATVVECWNCHRKFTPKGNEKFCCNRSCAHCGLPFMAKSTSERFCSEVCLRFHVGR